jgi:hypothetical protein
MDFRFGLCEPSRAIFLFEGMQCETGNLFWYLLPGTLRAIRVELLSMFYVLLLKV